MTLVVKPISAMLTKDGDLFGKGDPYVVCVIGSEKKRTKTHKGGGKKPQWMDTLTFMSQGNVMSVTVFDDDIGKDQLMGEGSLNLNQFYSNPSRTENEYVDIVKNGKSAGRVLLSIEYQGPPMGGGNMGGGGWNNQPNNWGPPQGNNWGPPQGNNWGPPQGNNWGPPQGNNWGPPPNNGGWNNGPNNGGWNNGPNNGPNNGGWGNNGPNNGGWGNNGPNNGGWNNGPNNGPNNGGWGNNNGW